MTRPICLVGLRGSGKTTVGRELAQALGRRFIDLDDALEREQRTPIPELFARHGEPGFRALEADLLRRQLADLGSAVVATGGGVVLDAESRALLLTTRAVYLRVPPALSAARVEGDATPRPALVAGGPAAEAARLLELRERLYREVAEAEVDASGEVDAVAAAIVAALRLTPPSA